jgi:hypothetical protein
MNAHDRGQAATAKYQAGSQTTFVQRRITGYPEVTLLLSITGKCEFPGVPSLKKCLGLLSPIDT